MIYGACQLYCCHMLQLAANTPASESSALLAYLSCITAFGYITASLSVIVCFKYRYVFTYCEYPPSPVTFRLFAQPYKTTIAPLQRAQNAAARLVAQLGPRDHVRNVLRDLHWLPVQQRITYKLCLRMHLVHNDRAAVYLTDSVTATANISRRIRLRSASSFRYEQPRTRLKLGQRCFAFAGPTAWNSLPSR